MKELIYTAIFVGLAILFIILMVCMFDKKGDDKKTKETMKYQAGVYTSSILFNDNVLDVEVAVDEKKIKSISLVNLDESTATMYPSVEPALESLSEQIYKKQSLENITYSEENQYTSMVLINAIEDALDKAEVKKSVSYTHLDVYKRQVLMTDTVGFIRKLPHHLIDAFRSTLEEAKYADIILHVVDASNPQMDKQMYIVYDTPVSYTHLSLQIRSRRSI